MRFMIVSCGEALVDVVPEAVPGGGPMNVAIAAARLGVPAAFLGRISTDSDGELIWRYLLENGVDVRACERGDEHTARAIVEHTPKTVFRFEGEGTADTCLEGASLTALDDGPHFVHGGALGLFRGQTAEALALLAESHDGIVSLDPNVRPQIIDDRARWDHFHQRWLGQTNIYKASDEDIEWIWNGVSYASVAEHLLATQVSAVLVTHGPDGVTVYTGDGEVVVPGEPVEVVDTVGAGDTFVGSVLASLWDLGVRDPSQLDDLAIRGWQSIARRAVVAASIACSRKGANPPHLCDLPA